MRGGGQHARQPPIRQRQRSRVTIRISSSSTSFLDPPNLDNNANPPFHHTGKKRLPGVWDRLAKEKSRLRDGGGVDTGPPARRGVSWMDGWISTDDQTTDYMLV